MTWETNDDDLAWFLAELSTAIASVAPVDPTIVEMLGSPAPATVRATRMLANAVARAPVPFLLFMDDLHEISDQRCLDALSHVVAAIPVGSHAIIASRTRPQLPLARLRSQGREVEWDWRDLAMDTHECEQMLRAVGLDVPPQEATALTEATEGWPAGIYLAALARRSGARVGLSAIRGDDPTLGEHFRSEVLATLPPEDVRFLSRTSILDRLDGALCDAILEADHSAQTLARLAGQIAMVIPLADERGSYRYHHLFKDLLFAELETREPGLVPELHRRAAGYLRQAGDLEGAIDHALSGGDTDTAATLVATIAVPVHSMGRAATLRRWLDRFPDEDIGRWPMLAIIAAWLHAMAGDATLAQRWADAVGIGGRLPGDHPLEPANAILRAVLCRQGVEQMMADATFAHDRLPTYDAWARGASLALGAALYVNGRIDEADETFAECATLAEEHRSFPGGTVAYAWRAAIACSRSDFPRAEDLVRRSFRMLREGRLEEYMTSALTFAVASRCSQHDSEPQRAATELASAQRLLPSLTSGLPWYSVFTRLQIARAQLSMSDPGGARVQLLEMEEILHLRPRLGVLVDEVAALREQLAAFPSGVASASTLTTAEIRLIPYLPTHLTFAEIGQRLFVSRSTVKTQALSIYRKLGVSSRNEAVERARTLSLLQD